MLDPIPLLIAIPDCPFLATIIEDNRSGIEVPAASTVNPIMTLGIPKICVLTTALSTKTQLKPKIHTIDNN